MYFDHCARRSPTIPVVKQRRLPSGGRLKRLMPLGSPSGGGVEVPVGVVQDAQPLSSATVATPALPVASSSCAFAASRTTGSGKGHRRRRSSLRRRRHRRSSSSPSP